MFNKSNKYFDTEKVDNTESDTITLIVRDGYQDGDKLSLNLEGINYSWQPDSRSLVIQTDESTNVSYIINNVSLEGQGVADRFVEAKYVSKDGEAFDLAEYNFQPDVSINSEIIQHNDNIDVQQLLEMIEEDVGADLINSQEENIPYYVTPINDGHVYEILQSSFSNNDSIEIFNYDVQADKVNIKDFIKDFSSAFEYSVISNNNDVQLNMHHDESDYSIVFKDVLQDLDDNIDAILNTVIFKS